METNDERGSLLNAWIGLTLSALKRWGYPAPEFSGVLMELEHYAEVLESVEKAIELDPHNSNAKRRRHILLAKLAP